MLKMKLQYFGHLMQRTDSLDKTLMLGKIKAVGEGDNRGWDGWVASWTRWTWVWASSRCCWWTGKPGMLQSMRQQRVWHAWATELSWMLVDSLRGKKNHHKIAKQNGNNRLKSGEALASCYHMPIFPYWTFHEYWESEKAKGWAGKMERNSLHLTVLRSSEIRRASQSRYSSWIFEGEFPDRT